MGATWVDVGANETGVRPTGVTCAAVGLDEIPLTGLAVLGNKIVSGAEVGATTGGSVGVGVGAMGEILMTT